MPAKNLQIRYVSAVFKLNDRFRSKAKDFPETTMKKIFMISAVCLLMMAKAAFAQTKSLMLGFSAIRTNGMKQKVGAFLLTVT
jgi:hypothetical protein